uniref:Uncharacterized protein n=1 Tax=Tanacetum cinerariifolium TaxID=118510 RepID=A0A699H9W7_TANCI|nr:hypothetical protein [Tanacetum cinerariifolium]
MKEGYGDREITVYLTQVFSVNNWAVKPNQPEEPSVSNHMLAIYATDTPMVFKPLNPSSNAERVPQGTKPGTKPEHKKPSSSEQSFEMMPQQFPQLKLILENSAPSDFVPLHQDQTKSVSEGLETVLTQSITRKGASSVARQIEEETSSTIKLEDLAKQVSHVQTSFKDLDSPEDDTVIVVDDSDEDEEDEVHATENVETEDTSVPTSSSHSSLPTKLKDLPSKFNEPTKKVKGLKKQVHELEIELPGDLKEILTKLEDFTQTVTIQAKLKTLDALPSLLLNVTKAFNKFVQGSSQSEGEHIKKDKGKKAVSPKDAEEKKEFKKFDFVTESGEHVHLTEEHISAPKKIKEEAKAEAVRREGEMRKKELIDLLGPEVVNKYYNDKLQYDRYCDKMLNRRAKSRITNYDILTRKGPITLKVYKEDDTSEIIHEFKASDLHLGEWREVVTACPNKKGKRWTSIYKQIQERMNYLRTTEAELGIDLDRPLSKQDSLDRLNDLANKKRKHADDIHDFFRANKGLTSALQVLRRLGSIFTLVYAAVQKLKNDSWKELQFSLVDNSKLNVVYLLNRS